MKIYLLCLLVLAFLVGCLPKEHNPIEQYLALSPVQVDAGSDARIQNFVNLYNHLENTSVAVNVEKTSAFGFGLFVSVISIRYTVPAFSWI